MSERDRSKDKNGGKKKSGRGWALQVFLLAVVLSALLSFFSSTALEGTGYIVAALVLAVFIGLGIVFDMIGVAVAAVIVTQLQRDFSTSSVLISIGATALISGITIGGKALGKTVAINQCTSVVYRVARIMHALHLSR